jgi:hypothetical protein
MIKIELATQIRKFSWHGNVLCTRKINNADGRVLLCIGSPADAILLFMQQRAAPTDKISFLHSDFRPKRTTAISLTLFLTGHTPLTLFRQHHGSREHGHRRASHRPPLARFHSDPQCSRLNRSTFSSLFKCGFLLNPGSSRLRLRYMLRCKAEMFPILKRRESCSFHCGVNARMSLAR